MTAVCVGSFLFGTLVPRITVALIARSRDFAGVEFFVSLEDFFARFNGTYVYYGPSFRLLKRVSFSGSKAFGIVDSKEYGASSNVLDCCLQLCSVISLHCSALIPSKIEEMVVVSETWTGCIFVYAERVLSSLHVEVYNLVLSSESSILALVVGFEVAVVSQKSLSSVFQRQSDNLLYEVFWAEKGMDARDLKREIPSVFFFQDKSFFVSSTLSVPQISVGTLIEPIIESSTNALVCSFIVEAFDDICPNWRETGLSNISPRYERAAKRLLACLKENPFESLDSSVHLRKSVGFSPELVVCLACGPHLSKILRGDLDPIALLFPSGSDELVAPLYKDSLTSKMSNSIAAEILEGYLETTFCRPLRVLEIGGGTGGTTGSMLEVLGRYKNFQYVFTDVSLSLLKRSELRFKNFGSVMEFSKFDIENNGDVKKMGLFDVIVAANVLHATTSITATVANVKKLLRDGGILIAPELTHPSPMEDISFGLLDGWWLFERDRYRSDHPLLSCDAWKELLHSCKFDDFGAVSPCPEKWAVIYGFKTKKSRSIIECPFECDTSDENSVRSHFHDSEFNLFCGLGVSHTNEPPSRLLFEQMVNLLKYFDKFSCHGSKFWILSQNCQYVKQFDLCDGFGSSVLWGFGRVARTEFPKSGVHVVDLHSSDASHWINQLESSQNFGLDELCWRGRRCYQPSFRKKCPSSSELFLKNETILMVGGFGGLGSLLVPQLNNAGCEKMYICGRSGALMSSRSLFVIGHAVLISMLVDIERSVDFDHSIKQLYFHGGKEVTGFIHLALVLKDCSISKLSWSDFKSVLRPRVIGAVSVVNRLKSTLRFVWLFSSISGLTGTHGQAGYSASCTFLDSFAFYVGLRFPSISAKSLDWGATSGVGMFAKLQKEGRVENSEWLLEIEARDVGPLFAKASLLEWNQVAVFSCCEKKLPPSILERSLWSSFGSITSEFRVVKSTEVREKVSVLDRVRQVVCDLTGVSLFEVEDKHRFVEYGIDSLSALEFRQRLCETFNYWHLSSSVVFDYPTIEVLVKYLEAQVTANEVKGESTASVQEKLATQNELSIDFVILGYSQRFAENFGGLKNVLSGDICAVEEIIQERFDYKEFFNLDSSSQCVSKWGSFLRNVGRFDYYFFNISEAEFECMDPQHYLILESSWNALEDGGIDCMNVDPSTGVWIALMNQDFKNMRGVRVDPFSGAGTAFSSAAGRISHFFGLSGPSIPVDTACSSSLVALHLGLQSLRRGEVQQGIVAGVNVCLSPFPFIAESRSNMLSPVGRCKTFDSEADGFVRGEGVGSFLLGPWNENCRSIVKSSGVNHNGRSVSLSSPDGGAQERLLGNVLEKGGLKCESVSVVEGFGVGSKFGDAVEVGSLLSVYGRNRNLPLILTSGKTNIGHCESAAGVASLAKVMLSFSERRIPSLLHFKNLSELIGGHGMEYGKFCLPLENVESGKRSLCSISGFGFSGVNCHVVLESVSQEENDNGNFPYFGFCISSKTVEHLSILKSHFGFLSIFGRDIDFFSKVRIFSLLSFENKYVAPQSRKALSRLWNSTADDFALGECTVYRSNFRDGAKVVRETRILDVREFLRTFFVGVVPFDETKSFKQLGFSSIMMQSLRFSLIEEKFCSSSIPSLDEFTSVSSFIENVTKKKKDDLDIPVLTFSRSAFLRPCSAGQKSLFYLWKMRPSSNEYTVGSRIKAQFDNEVKLLRSCRSLQSSHELLQTSCFMSLNSNVYYRVHRCDPCVIFLERDEKLELLFVERALKKLPWDLGLGPFWRCVSSCYSVTLLFHHIVMDEWSGSVIEEELMKLSQDSLVPRTLNELEFSHFVESERIYLEERAEGDRKWWREMLQGSVSVGSFFHNFVKG